MKLTVQVETLVMMGAEEIPETWRSHLIVEVQSALKVIKSGSVDLSLTMVLEM